MAIFWQSYIVITLLDKPSQAFYLVNHCSFGERGAKFRPADSFLIVFVTSPAAAPYPDLNPDTEDDHRQLEILDVSVRRCVIPLLPLPESWAKEPTPWP